MELVCQSVKAESGASVKTEVVKTAEAGVLGSRVYKRKKTPVARDTGTCGAVKTEKMESGVGGYRGKESARGKRAAKRLKQ